MADSIEAALGANNVWVQGVGRDYAANLEGNLYPDGSPPKAIAEMTRLLRDANSKCPNAKIIAGGYSQGAALAAAAIRDIDAGIRNKIVGTALYGYTKNQQNNGQIINYPSDRLVVFCNQGDRVCEGTLIVAPPHLDYGDAASNAGPNFLVGKVRG
jgi:cutinase